VSLTPNHQLPHASPRSALRPASHQNQLLQLANKLASVKSDGCHAKKLNIAASLAFYSVPNNKLGTISLHLLGLFAID